MRLLLPLLLLSGCGSYGDLIAGDVPDGASILRCTQYEGSAGGGVMVSTNVQAQGCQCFAAGPPLSGVTIEMDGCKATFE